jgi:hypothetical protein
MERTPKGKARTPEVAPGDLLRNLKFVKLVAVQDLLRAELIQKILRDMKIGAVIINDERYQVRPESEHEAARPDGEAFRIEVPEPVIERARAVLRELEKAEEP